MGEYLIHMNEEGILTFTINRPEKRNAISYEVMNGLEVAMEESAHNNQVKALVITGSGDSAFCSGGDLSQFHNLKTESESYGMLSRMGGILTRLAFLPKPTIAFINGTAIGGGCEIATACDFRVAKRTARMGFVQGNLAITTGWGGGTLLLERLPASLALSLLMTARLETAEALYVSGFIDEVVDDSVPLQDIQLINMISSKSGGVLEAYKHQLLAKWDKERIKDNILEEIKRCSVLWARDEHHEAVDKFFNKE
ncbi:MULTISPECIES: enoyl-CoA hydratase/isomerase family protein [Bacillaceae]|uniref:enoyl-CoA hydratase/isomerase family protein n=1 Tax=Bacillaceae TaxID=186817 RepID=UPI001C55E308|nr:enoyl-CoA hydratase/isomerase family protein [Rossellomorea sp. YZS02]MBW3113980.1 enoyl-CoA hydratase/isomerase family protein [Bacillus sp. MCCB 382]MDX8342989.1 enoyl-CoA hydratase/isomerase family protein [Rossellomorea sp. YZS02]